MKNNSILFRLSCVVLCWVSMTMAFGASAQSHLTFKGVEINGSIRSVTSQLEQQGFATQSVSTAVGVMTGTFTGSIVTLMLAATPVSGTTYSVMVIYDEPSEGSMLLSSYDALKPRLTTKYGTPSEVIEHIEHPFSRTSGLRAAFISGKAAFRTTWTTEQGTVVLMMQYMLNKVVTAIVYADAANTSLNNTEIEGDL